MASSLTLTPSELIDSIVALIIFSILYQPWLLGSLAIQSWGYLLLSPQTYFLLATIVIAKRRRLSCHSLGLHSDSLPSSLILGLVLGCTPIVAVAAIGLLLTAIHSIFPILPFPIFSGEKVVANIQGPNLLILFLLAPVTEELFFRGILFQALCRHYSLFWSILLSSTLFMGSHGRLTFGPLVLGIINAVVLWKKRTLLPCIVFHMISNAFGPLILSQAPNLYHHFTFFF